MIVSFAGAGPAALAENADHLRQLQTEAIASNRSSAAHWGWNAENYTQWGTHSNRLIPVYTFGTKNAGEGIDLQSYTGANSTYRDEAALLHLYGRVPTNTVNAHAEYCDQTDVFRIQQAALAAGKKHIILVVFDGMDWNTTRAAAIYKQQAIEYSEGRGRGLHFQDYTAAGTTQFGYMVTAPYSDGASVDVNAQQVKGASQAFGGYDASRGGATPWQAPAGADQYLSGQKTADGLHHPYTDSACSATSMTAGIKSYNGSINYSPDGRQVVTIAHAAQMQGYAVGAVSSVPVSHATPAAAYAHNVSRNDYQDISRDLLGLPSSSHPEKPLPGLDVLIGGGYGSRRSKDNGQGSNFEAGNAYLADSDLQRANVEQGGQYVVAVRTDGGGGYETLFDAVERAIQGKHRLLGFYGVGAQKGHLPFATANGDFQTAPSRTKNTETYSKNDVNDNPTLAEMSVAALRVLASRNDRFWLMVEAGDVDWANHDNNLDNSIGAVLSGDAAVRTITDWVEQNSSWDETVMIVTADHGHLLVLDDPAALIAPKSE
ncbi:MAG: alkaline phosphatase [Planctomycetales bacterium]|nr:alkaline phosphatase [Planctomycetales bacterium]